MTIMALMGGVNAGCLSRTMTLLHNLLELVRISFYLGSWREVQIKWFFVVVISKTANMTEGDYSRITTSHT